MSKPNNVEDGYEELFLLSAIKTCTEMMIESELLLQDIDKTDAPIVFGMKEHHETRIKCARTTLKAWIKQYLKEDY